MPVLWRTTLQAEYRVEDYPGTPPSSVYQVTHGTAFQAAERNVMHLSYEEVLGSCPRTCVAFVMTVLL